MYNKEEKRGYNKMVSLKILQSKIDEKRRKLGIIL